MIFKVCLTFFELGTKELFQAIIDETIAFKISNEPPKLNYIRGRPLRDKTGQWLVVWLPVHSEIL